MKSITFGKRLSEIRKEKKISQDTLAKEIGVHGAVIGRYERDEVKPSIEMAAHIANALDVSLDYLVGNTNLKLDKAMIKRIQEVSKFSEKEKGHVFAMLDAFIATTKMQTYLNK